MRESVTTLPNLWLDRNNALPYERFEGDVIPPLSPVVKPEVGLYHALLVSHADSKPVPSDADSPLTGVSYHKDHVSRLLKTIDWTPQKPINHGTQRHEREIANWRTNVWPELKKSAA